MILLALVKLSSPRIRALLGSFLLCEWLWESIRARENFSNLLNTAFGSEQTARNNYRSHMAMVLSELLGINENLEYEQKELYYLLQEECTISKAPLSAIAMSILSDTEAREFYSASVFRLVVMTPLTDLSIFLDNLHEKFKIGLNLELMKSIRDDKYKFLSNSILRNFETSDICGPLVKFTDLWCVKDVCKVQLASKLNLDRYLGFKISKFNSGSHIGISAVEREAIDQWCLSIEPITFGVISFTNCNVYLLRGLFVRILQELVEDNIERAKALLDKSQNLIFEANV